MIVEGQTATNPQTGQRIIYKGGRWYPMAANGAARTVATAGGAAAKLAPEDQQALNALGQDAAAKRTLADRAGQFVAQQGNVATGPGYAPVDIPFTKINMNPMRAIQDVRAGIPGAGGPAPTLQALDLIANQSWPLMRPVGQGRLLQTEAAAFKKAFPSVTNFGPANQQIAERLANEAKMADARLRFAQTYVHGGKGSVADAMSDWDSGLPTDPQLAGRWAAARDAYYQSWLEHGRSLQGVDAGWQHFAAKHYGSGQEAAPPASGQAAGGGQAPVAKSADGHTIVYRDGAWRDARTGTPVG